VTGDKIAGPTNAVTGDKIAGATNSLEEQRTAAAIDSNARTMMTRYALMFSLAVACAPAFAALPVTPAPDQAALLKSSDKKLAANKKAAYDFFRIILRGRHLDQTEKFMLDSYIQHNPNAETGMKGFKDFFTKQGGPTAIPETLPGLVAIQAEGDYVTLSFVREYDDPAAKGKKYTTTWFDMFRFENGKIAEHWDSALKAQ
jgi:predicted SnoaL-like aldol condensation-catalyzing enzyme